MNSPVRKTVVWMPRADSASRMAEAPRSEEPASNETRMSGRSAGPRVRSGTAAPEDAEVEGGATAGPGRTGGGTTAVGRGDLGTDGAAGATAAATGAAGAAGAYASGEDSGIAPTRNGPFSRTPSKAKRPFSTGAAPRKRAPEKRKTAAPSVEAPSRRSPLGDAVMESRRAVGASRRGRA